MQSHSDPIPPQTPSTSEPATPNTAGSTDFEEENYPYSQLILPQLFEGEDLMLPGAFLKAKFEMELGDKDRFGDVSEGLNSFVFELTDPLFSLRTTCPVTAE